MWKNEFGGAEGGGVTVDFSTICVRNGDKGGMRL